MGKLLHLDNGSLHVEKATALASDAAVECMVIQGDWRTLPVDSWLSIHERFPQLAKEYPERVALETDLEVGSLEDVEAQDMRDACPLIIPIGLAEVGGIGVLARWSTEFGVQQYPLQRASA